MTGVAYTSYIDEDQLPYFFCPGCGHGKITDALNAALVKLQLDPQKVVVVTDIGCSGLVDKYFTTHTLHGLHGRSVTYATGIKLANPELKVIVLMGDGGCGIGGHHLVNAARRNIGVTVVVFNNFNYGMTGGEHSVTTPSGGITSSTPYGQLEYPMDICQTVAVNGATYVARSTSFDKNLSSMLAAAIQNDGFSLVDIWELCTAYYVPNNHFSKSMLESTLAKYGFPTGVIHTSIREEYSRAYRHSTADQPGREPMPARILESKYQSELRTRMGLVFAGAAGKKINSAATLFCQGAVLSGLWAAQRNDYPVTVKSGHSVSEVILSDHEIGYTGITRPNLMLVLFKESLSVVSRQIEEMDEGDILIASSDLLPVKTRAKPIALDFTQTGFLGKKEYWAVIGMAALLCAYKVYPLEAFKEAASWRKEFTEATLSAIEAGVALSHQLS